MSSDDKAARRSSDERTVEIPGETWFFRYPDSFEHLRQVARSSPKAGPWRVASLGCASGAEPCSIVAALDGIRPVRVVAVDRSRELLAMARGGRLRPFVVRSERPSWAPTVWTIDEGAVVVPPSILSQIDFVEADLLNPRLADDLGAFDVVFCRNILIYMSPTERRTLGQLIARLLKPGGWLYLGHAEQPSALELPWRKGASKAFAFLAPSSVAEVHDITTAPRSKASDTQSRAGRLDQHAEGSRSAASPPPPSTKPARAAPLESRGVNEPPSIEHIREMADSGQVVPALEAARRRHDAGERSAELLELLGTLLLAEGETEEAARHLRAAVYLEPDRAEAAMQLDLLREGRLRGVTAPSEHPHE